MLVRTLTPLHTCGGPCGVGEPRRAAVPAAWWGQDEGRQGNWWEWCMAKVGCSQGKCYTYYIPVYRTIYILYIYYIICSPFSSVLEFVCLPWSEVCSARVTSLLLLLLLLLHHHHHQKAFRNKSHTSHGHRPGLKRNKSKGKRLTIN